MATGLRVQGLRELNRAFAQTPARVKREMRGELRRVGEPVRVTSEQLAVARIRNIGPVWSRMKIGTTQSFVYVAPATRPSGRGSKRPNLARLWLQRAMLPAARGRMEQTRQAMDLWIRSIAARSGL